MIKQSTDKKTQRRERKTQHHIMARRGSNSNAREWFRCPPYYEAQNMIKEQRKHSILLMASVRNGRYHF